MRILVTGSTGFIGKRLVPALEGHEVMQVWRNGRDRTAKAADVAAFRAEAVIHLGWPGVYGPERHNEPIQADGYRFTRWLLRNVGNDCKRWIGVGSQAEISTPATAYARYKTAARHESQLWCERRGIACTWARLFSVYGPGSDPRSFLPTLVRELVSGSDPDLTDQDIPWDFLYVDDAVSALVMLALADKGPDVCDIASGCMTQTKTVARLVRDKINLNATLRFGAKPMRAVELPWMPIPNVAPMMAMGWNPTVTLSDGIDRLIESIKKGIA